MGKLLLTRHAGESVQLERDGVIATVSINLLSYKHGVTLSSWVDGNGYATTVRVGHSYGLPLGVTLTVCSIQRGQTKLAFEAPAEVKILRTELVGSAPK